MLEVVQDREDNNNNVNKKNQKMNKIISNSKQIEDNRDRVIINKHYLLVIVLQCVIKSFKLY